MKWLNSIVKYSLLTQVSRLLAIEVIELKGNDGNDFTFNAISVVKKKREITIQKKATAINYSELALWLKDAWLKNSAILLVANSSRILHKVITNKSDLSEEEKIKLLLPNVKSDDFFCYSCTLDNDTEFVSLVRKNYLQSILQQFSSYKKHITHVAIGPSPMFTTYKLAFSKNDDDSYKVDFKNYHFLFKNSRLQKFDIDPYIETSDQQEIIHIGSETIDSSLLIIYSYVANYFLNPMSLPGINTPAALTANGDFIFKKVANILTGTYLLFIFILLSVSTVIFTTVNSRYQKLLTTYAQNKHNWENVATKNIVYDKQKRLLERNGLANQSRISFYADQLTWNLPEDIYLSKMDIHPVNTRTMSDNVEFIGDKILIEGNSYSSTELSDWVNNLKKLPWIAGVLIRDFKDNGNIGTFVIEITKRKT